MCANMALSLGVGDDVWCCLLRGGGWQALGWGKVCVSFTYDVFAARCVCFSLD